MAYISVTDAVERTGKGQTTIYRFCRKYEHTRHIKREEKKFLIDEDLLLKHFSVVKQEQANHKDSQPPKREMVDMFIEELQKELVYNRRHLERKDEQLARKDTIIANLQERQRELHHLLHHQTRLLENLRQPEEPKPEAQEPPAAKAATAPSPSLSEIRLVYFVLACVGILLLLAIIFVDEIRAVI